MKARKIFLLLLILIVGGSLETAWTVRDHVDFGPAGCRVIRGKFYGSSFDFTSDETREVPSPAIVEVENAFGRVSVKAGEAGRVRIALRKVVFLPTEDRARAFADKIRLEAVTSGSTLRLKTNRQELEHGAIDEVGFETHLDIIVPPGTRATVRNEHGRVEVADVAEADVEGSYDGVQVERVKGASRIQSRHGDVSASEIGGALDLTSRYGSVTLRDVSGTAVLDTQHGDVSLERTAGLRLQARHGDVTARVVHGDLEIDASHSGVEASDVSGQATVQTEFKGVTLQKVEGDVRVKNQHGEIEVSDVRGRVSTDSSYDDVVLRRIGGAVEVAVEHGGVRAEELAAGARIKSSGGDVTVEGFRGAIEVDARRASVHLVPEGAVTEPISVKTETGEIHLVVPAGSRFDLEAVTRTGEVQAEGVPGLSVTETSRERITGKVGGGGKTVKLEAERGNITLEVRPAVASKER